MIYAGVDIAKMDHVIGAVDETGAEAARPMKFKNSEAGFERCIAWLESVAEGEDGVFVGMEATGHYWKACFAYLTAAGYRVCVVNPMQVHAMRKLKGMPGVKNDRVDSWLIAETLRQGDYDETRLATDEVQALKQLTRYHQGLKQELAAVKTQAICVLDAYFPEYAGLFSDMFGSASLKVLAECPTPSEVERRRAATIAKLLSEGSRGRLGEAKAAQVKAAAKSSVGIRLGEEAASFQIRTMVSQVEFLNAHDSQGREGGRLAPREGRARHHDHPRRVDDHRRPDRRRDRRREEVQERRVDREVRGAQLRRRRVGQVLGRGRSHNQAWLALPAQVAVAGREPGQAVRPEAQGVLRQAAPQGQAPQGRRHRGGEEALPHRLRGHAGRRALRPGKIG